MSVICKTFVQNTWRRDLCSNCFKSKEEHGGGGGGGGGLIGGGGGVGGGSVDLGLGEEEEDFSLEGVRPGSKRYVGVAGRVYQRGYYAQNSWKSLVIDKSDPSTPSAATRPTSSVSLMSPALIRGVASSLVTQENEKNRKLSDLDTPDLFGSDRLTRRLSSTLTTTGTAAPTTPATVPPPRQSQAKILSQLLDDKEEVEERREEGKKSVDKEEFEKGDASSDLGSEASNDSVVSSASSPSSPSSTSSVASSSTCQVSYSAPNSDTASIKSEGKEEEEEEEESKIQTIIVPPKSILRKTSSPKKTKRSKEGRRGVTFNSQLQELIGYGGDVDYGDDEEEGYQDEDDEDDDDEDFFEDLASLTPHERMLRRETMKNTEYNSDNKNLSKDIPEDEILPSVQELEEKRKLILAEIEALERLGRENKLRNEKVKEVVKEAVQEDTTKQEARVKLKRSSPLVSTKPLIARTSSSEPRVNQVLPMKNGEVVRPGVTAPVAAPLIDAPPKYVSLEEEMVEKEIPLQERPDEVKNTHKVTSIDDVYEIKEKVTCLDDVCRPKKDASPSPPPSGSATEPPAVPRPTTAPPARPAPPSKAPAVRSASECGKAVTKDQAVKENKGIEKKSASPPLPSTSPPTTTTITTTTPASTPSSTSTSTTVTTSSTNTSSTTTTKPSTATTTTTSTITTTPTKAPHPVSAPRKSLTNGTAKKEPVLRRTSTTTSTTTTTTTTTSMTEKVVKKEDSPSVTVKSDASPASSHMESQAKESRVSQSESGVPSMCESPRLVTQSSLESTKAPASRQSSTSSCMSTFGTPIMLPTTTSSSSTPPQQNTSFLHSSRGAYEDPYSCPANLVAPATPDFLREIKTPPEVPTPTAGISKSALYASTSCLKGLPGARPVITPKPPMLKEKPRVPLKPPPATRGIYATPAPVTPKVPITGLSGAVSTPNLASMGDSALSLVPKQTHPPVAHAFSTPVRKEAVYDIPVTLPPTTTTTTTTSSTTSPTPTTITQNKPPTDDTIYHEITDTLTSTTTTTTTTTSSPSNIQRHESARCQTRSTFEANRSLLSAALDFNSRANLARRSAPTPAEDDEEDQGHPEEPEGTTQTLQDVQKDRESASSFTDDFDDDDEEEFGEERKREEIHQALPAITTTTATSSSSLFRNSIGPIVTHETQGPYQHPSRPQEVEEHPRGTSDDLQMYQVPQTRPIASRSHSVPRASDHVVRRVNEVTGPLVTSAAPVSIIGGTVTSSSSASSRFFSRSGFFRPSSPPAGGKKDTTSSSFSSSSSERGRERTKKTSSSSSSSSSSSRQFLKRLLRLGGGKEEDKGKEVKKEALKKGRPTIIHPLDYNGQGVEVIARPEKTMPLYDYSGIYGYVPPPQAVPRLPPEETYAIPAQARASPVPSSSSLSATSSISSDPPTSARGEGGGVVYDPTPLPTSLPAPYTTTTSTISTTSTTTTTNSTSLEKRNSSVRKQESTSGGAEVERRESLLSHTSTTTTSTTSTNNNNNNNSSSSTHGLGYNSEGDVRAPITPRKPGRSSSIRGEEDREKRRAPQPPAIIQQAAQEAAQKASSRYQHQKQDSISSTGSSSTPRPVSKGPAPARPPPHPNSATANTEAALEEDDDTGPKYHHYPQQQQDKESAEDGGGGGGGGDQGTRTRRRTRRTNSDRRNPQEGGGRLSGGRAGPLAPRSLQAQYGAVMSANMDALANILDQLSAETHPQGYEDLVSMSATWGDINIDDRILVGAGQRLFYQGALRGRDVTLMLTSEAKIEAHHLLTPLPLVAFKEDHLPARLLSHRTIVRGNFSPGTVWVLPPMKLTTLRSRIKEEMREPGPGEWLQDACLLLLQLVTGLKQLQARGVEETSLDLAVVARDSRDPHPRLILVPPPPDACGGAMSLCQCAAAATLLLVGALQPEQQAREGSCEVPPSIPSHHAFVCLLQLLHKERSVSLTQAKRVLEAMLFGPESFLAGEEEDEDEEEEDDEQVEATLERWLDLERATVLHSLTRGPPHSPILTKFHLLFLVSTSARVMREAVRLLAAARPQPPEVTSF